MQCIIYANTYILFNIYYIIAVLSSIPFYVIFSVVLTCAYAKLMAYLNMPVLLSILEDNRL